MGINACGGGDETPDPVVLDPNQVKDMIGIYEGTLITSLETFENQRFGINDEGDSTIILFSVGETEVPVGIRMEAIDLSPIGDSTVVLTIPYQIVGSDTIQGAPLGAETHGTYTKSDRKLRFSIKRLYYSDLFDAPAVSDEFFEGERVQ